MLEYARHEAILNMPDKDGLPARETYKAALKHGSREAAEMLEPREMPEGFEYLYDWSTQLIGRSGVGMSGLLPLSFTEIASWSILTGNTPTPDEVNALLALDSVMRHPETKKKEEPEEQKMTPVAAWPVRKNDDMSA